MAEEEILVELVLAQLAEEASQSLLALAQIECRAMEEVQKALG